MGSTITKHDFEDHGVSDALADPSLKPRRFSLNDEAQQGMGRVSQNTKGPANKKQ